jgi:hypothetical protein
MDIQSNAGLLWGRNTPTRRDAVLAALSAIDSKMAKRLGKREPSASWCLISACRDIGRAKAANEHGTLDVRPLANTNGYEAIVVRRKAIQNEEELLFSAKAAGDVSVLLRVHASLNALALEKELVDAYQARRTMMSPDQVSRCLGLVVARLGGVPLDGINVSYVPPQEVDRLRTFLDASGIRHYRVTTFGISTDPDTVADVLAAVRRELADGIDAIADKVESGDISRRQAKAIAVEADRLHAKAAAYESQFGVSLSVLTEQLTRVANASAVSSLLAASI